MLNWTEPKPPTQGISTYDYVTCNTPLGQAIIEWKGWKEYDSYSLTIGREYIGESDSLEEAKQLAEKHLTSKRDELNLILGNNELLEALKIADLILNGNIISSNSEKVDAAFERFDELVKKYLTTQSNGQTNNQNL